MERTSGVQWKLALTVVLFGLLSLQQLVQAACPVSSGDNVFGPSDEYYLKPSFSYDFTRLIGEGCLGKKADDLLTQDSSPEVDCYKIFKKFSSSSSRSPLGWGAKCTLRMSGDYHEVTVELGRSFTIGPDSLISVNSEPFNENSGSDAIPIIFVGSLEDYESPVARITSPSKIGECSPLIVDGSESYFPHISIPLNYEWAVKKAGDIIYQQSGSPILRWENFTNSDPGAYTVDFKVTAFSRSNTGGTTQVSSKISTDIDKVTYAVPRVRIAGGSQLSTPWTKPFSIYSVVDTPECYHGDNLQFEWTEIVDGIASNISDAQADSSKLKFENGINSPNRTFRVSVRYTDDDTGDVYHSEVETTVSGYEREFSALVDGGSRVVNIANRRSKAIENGESNPLVTFDSSVSNPDDPSASVTYSWDVPSSIVPYVDGGLSGSSLGLSVNQLFDFIDGNALDVSISVNASTVSSNTGEEKLAQDTVLITFSNNEPSIEFVNPSYKINPNEVAIFRIRAEASPDETILGYEWSMSDLTKPLKNYLLLGTREDRTVLAIEPSSLTPGSVHTLTATVKTSSTAKSVSIQVEVNTPPSGGSLSFSPSVGSVLQKAFLSCENYEDADGPLQYSFSYRHPTTGDLIPLSPMSPNKYIEVPFPLAGTGLNNTITVQAAIQDNMGSETVTETEIQVVPLKSETELEARLNALKQEIETLEDRGDLLKLQVLVGALSRFLGENETPFLTSDARRDLRTLLSSKMQLILQMRSSDTRDFTSSELQFQASAFDSLLGQKDEVSSSAQRSASSVISQMTQDHQDMVDSSSAKAISQSLSSLISSVADLPVANADRADITQNIVQTTELVTKRLAKLQVEGQTTTSVSTDQIRIAVAKYFSSDISDETNVHVDRASTTIPSGIVSSDGSSDSDGDESVAVQMSVMRANPYYSKESEINSKLTADVTRLKFSAGDSTDALPVSDIEEGFTFVIPAQNDMDRIEHDLSEAGNRPVCRYWDEDSQDWSKYGCEMVSYDATSTKCKCNHTTDFSAALEFALPNINTIGEDEIQNLAELNQDSMTTIIVMSVVLGLYIIAMTLLELAHIVCCSVRKILNKRKNHRRATYKKGYIRPLIDKVLTSHIWLSLIVVPESQSNFTRSMRLTVIMIILLGSMGSNALTFGQQQANIVQTILAAFLGDLLVTPFVLIFTFVFLKISSDNSMLFKKSKKNQKPSVSPSNSEKSSEEVPHRTPISDGTNAVNSESTESDMQFEEDLGGNDIYSKKEALYDKIDVILGKVYNRYRQLADKSILYGLAVFTLATLVYFAVISLGSYAIATAAEWMGIIGIMAFCSCATITYFAFLEIVYLNTKMKRFKQTNMAWKNRTTSRIGIAIGIGILTLLFAGIITCIFFMREVNSSGYQWEYLFVIQLALFGMMVLTTIWIGFLIISPKKKAKKGGKKKQKESFLKRPWLPNLAKYPVYALAWGWMAGMSFILVVYGVNFDIQYGKGTSLKWLLASSGSQVQNVMLNKPMMFVIRFVVLTAIIKMFEFLFFRSQYVDDKEDNDEVELNTLDDAGDQAVDLSGMKPSTSEDSSNATFATLKHQSVEPRPLSLNQDGTSHKNPAFQSNRSSTREAAIPGVAE